MAKSFMMFFNVMLLMFERMSIPDTAKSQIKQLQVFALLLIDFCYGELGGDILSSDVCQKCDPIPYDVGVGAERLHDRIMDICFFIPDTA